MLDHYLRLMRVLYLTRRENLEAAGYFAPTAARFAGSTVFACACMHLAIPVLLAIAATGGIKGLPDSVPMLIIFALAGIVLWWEVRYVERSPSLNAMWSELRAESEEARSRRRKLINIVIWGTVAVLILSFGTLVLSVLPG